MLKEEYERLKTWVTAPVNTQLPLWQILVFLMVFIIVVNIVIDNQDLINTDFSV